LASSKNELIGKNLEDIYKKLANKKRGSKKYTKLLCHKYNEINRIINELKLDNTKLIVVENLKGVKTKSKFNKKFNNKLQYWSYAQVLTKLNTVCQEKGIYLLKVSPTYTSQTCHSCGTVDKNARQGESYRCSVCGMTENADINAAQNILHRGIYSSSNTHQTNLS
jgi:IS605 OrfB family transposase